MNRLPHCRLDSRPGTPGFGGGDMSARISRRRALKDLGLAGAGLAFSGGVIRGQAPNEIVIAGQPVEIAVSSVSPLTVRITLRPIRDGAPAAIAQTGHLVQEEFGTGAMRTRSIPQRMEMGTGGFIVRCLVDGAPRVYVDRASGEPIQKLTFDAAAPGMSFLLPKGPLLGLGEGGVQFDKKGSTDQMRNGQVTSQADGYGLSTHGTRAPVQWLVGTDGWAMFIHQPYGTFDFKGDEGKFLPRPEAALPLDVFVVASKDPLAIMREY